MSVEGKNVIFVLGGPGCGKGTNAISISKEFGFGYAAAGDILRAEAADPESPNGQKISAIMKAGQLVPPELLIESLKNAIRKSNCKYFLLDGFPRSLVQDDAWRAQTGQVDCAIMIDAPDQVLIDRIRGRSVDSGRADDDPSVVVKRLETYKTESLPVIQRYEKENLLVKIDGNRTKDEVRADFVAVLHKYWQF